MGYTTWSDGDFLAAKKQRQAIGQKDFAYSDDLKKQGISQWQVNPALNPRGVSRESRDSAIHPESLAIMVIFDITGSMLVVPQILQQNLPKLMATLLGKGVAHPQVLFGAVGDAYTDKVPLQIGQFESGVEMDADVRNIFLEGRGGGQMHESYQLPIYFAARHTSIDCWEKRGKKGYLFIIGDEKMYDQVEAAQIADIIGDKLSENISTKAILAEAKGKYHIFYLIPTATSYAADPAIRSSWRAWLGDDNVRQLDKTENIAEFIAEIVVETETKNSDSDSQSVTPSLATPKKKYGRLM